MKKKKKEEEMVETQPFASRSFVRRCLKEELKSLLYNTILYQEQEHSTVMRNDAKKKNERKRERKTGENQVNNRNKVSVYVRDVMQWAKAKKNLISYP